MRVDRRDDLVTLMRFPTSLVVGLHHGSRRHYSLAAMSWLEAHFVHTGDLHHEAAGTMKDLENALRGLNGLQRMHFGHLRQSGQPLVYLGVVLGRAGALSDVALHIATHGHL